jgi:methionine sulfoxide reductase catalytic subunit
MHVIRKNGWNLPESAATDESVYMRRRDLLKVMGLAPAILATSALPSFAADDPTADLYPVMQNLRYRLDRAVTDEELATTYNNFYEFGSHKKISEAAQALKIRPWQVRFDGMVEKEMTVDFDDLVRQMPLEERLYRHRCVETWSMAVPWSGFPMKALIDFAKPMSGAKYVVMQTQADKETMPGLKEFWYPWPYTEGLTIAEATNELAFIATGLYGKPIPKQNGAPLRLVAPWKYGFKGIKSIVRFSFTDKRPVGYWEKLQGAEYGFWANVNPEVPHARWSQANEKMLGEEENIPTLLYNGYGEYVADLYKDMKGEKLFM